MFLQVYNSLFQSSEGTLPLYHISQSARLRMSNLTNWKHNKRPAGTLLATTEDEREWTIALSVCFRIATGEGIMLGKRRPEKNRRILSWTSKDRNQECTQTNILLGSPRTGLLWIVSSKGSFNTDQYIAFPLGRENKNIFELGGKAIIISVRMIYIDTQLMISSGEL